MSELERRQVVVTFDGGEVIRGYADITKSGDKAGTGMMRVGLSATRTETDFKKLGQTLSKSGDKLVGFAKSIERHALRATKALAGIVVGGIIGGSMIAKSAVEAAAMRQRDTDALAAIMGSAKAAQNELLELKKVAAMPGVDLTGAMKISRSLQMSGKSAAFARRMISEVGNSLVLAGKGAEELDRVGLALMQMYAKGKLSQEELLQLVEAGIPVFDLLKRTFGTGDAEALRKAGVTVDQVVTAILDELGKLPRAAGGAANSIDNLNIAIGEAKIALGAGILGADTTKGIDELTKRVEALAPELTKLGVALQPVIKSLFDLAMTAADKAPAAIETLIRWINQAPDAFRRMRQEIQPLLDMLQKLLDWVRANPELAAKWLGRAAVGTAAAHIGGAGLQAAGSFIGTAAGMGIGGRLFGAGRAAAGAVGAGALSDVALRTAAKGGGSRLASMWGLSTTQRAMAMANTAALAGGTAGRLGMLGRAGPWGLAAAGVGMAGAAGINWYYGRQAARADETGNIAESQAMALARGIRERAQARQRAATTATEAAAARNDEARAARAAYLERRTPAAAGFMGLLGQFGGMYGPEGMGGGPIQWSRGGAAGGGAAFKPRSGLGGGGAGAALITQGRVREIGSEMKDLARLDQDLVREKKRATNDAAKAEIDARREVIRVRRQELDDEKSAHQERLRQIKEEQDARKEQQDARKEQLRYNVEYAEAQRDLLDAMGVGGGRRGAATANIQRHRGALARGLFAEGDRLGAMRVQQQMYAEMQTQREAGVQARQRQRDLLDKQIAAEERERAEARERRAKAIRARDVMRGDVNQGDLQGGIMAGVIGNIGARDQDILANARTQSQMWGPATQVLSTWGDRFGSQLAIVLEAAMQRAGQQTLRHIEQRQRILSADAS